ncbi:amino acid ABC transporter permease [Sinorhizobium meliloti]|uniref:amino acid ABC transporter permease n=1 Tax=Rhizobium meliloti TaxID=382 RepID=UPI00398D3B3A
MALDFTLFAQYWPILLHGLLITTLCSAAAAAIGITLGIPLSLMLLSKPKLVSSPARVYVEIMRGLPALLVLFLLYYGGPSVGLSLTPMAAGIIGLGLYSAAYFAEIFRGGFLSISTGQIEAAQMLGFDRRSIVTKIELPQMKGLILPPVINQLIALVKDSALLSMLTIADLTKAATQMSNETFAFIEPYLAIAILYWLLNTVIAYFGNRLKTEANAYR